MNSFVIGPDSVIITNNRLGAGLPQQFQDYLQELITEIEAGRVDALDQNFPTMVGQAIVALANVFVARAFATAALSALFFQTRCAGHRN